MTEATIGLRIKEARKALGITQDDLATRLEITPQSVSKWESDASLPDSALLVGLTKALNVTADYLLTGIGELPEKEIANWGKILTNVDRSIDGNVGNVDATVNGNINGNVTGSVRGAIMGDVHGNIEGNVLGYIDGDVDGYVAGNVLGMIKGSVKKGVRGKVAGSVVGDGIGNNPKVIEKMEKFVEKMNSK